MTVFFISDLHLNEQFTNSYNLFVKFFNCLPASTKAIYILGDLFEYWIDDQISSKFINNIQHILYKVANEIPIYFIRGNRDFLIGKCFSKKTNITILSDPYQLDLYGKKILLSHGDGLCTLDRSHVFFTKFIRSSMIINIANWLPVSLKLLIADQIRSLSKKKYMNYLDKLKNNIKSINIYDVCPKAVEKIMVKYSANIIIHGHTHKPQVHEHENFTRIVLGDWTTKAKILVFNKDLFELKTLCL